MQLLAVPLLLLSLFSHIILAQIIVDDGTLIVARIVRPEDLIEKRSSLSNMLRLGKRSHKRAPCEDYNCNLGNLLRLGR